MSATASLLMGNLLYVLRLPDGLRPGTQGFAIDRYLYQDHWKWTDVQDSFSFIPVRPDPHVVPSELYLHHSILESKILLRRASALSFASDVWPGDP